MEEEVKSKLQEVFKADIVEATVTRPRRIFVRISPGSFKEAFRYSVESLGFDHLCTISGVDLKTEFEMVYHLSKNGVLLSLAVKVNREKPEIETVTNVIPGAILYEREVSEMFGIVIKHIPDSRPVVLPENWPKGQYPLRKDWNRDMLPESMTQGLRRKWTE